MSNRNKILWSERDPGQKFSIVMFGLCMVAATAFMTYAGSKAALAGDWGQLITAAGFVLFVVSLGLQWSKRNAG